MKHWYKVTCFDADDPLYFVQGLFYYGTLISLLFIYNSRTTSRILTKFSGMKYSSITKLVAKIRLPEVFAMETLTHSLFFLSRLRRVKLNAKFSILPEL